MDNFALKAIKYDLQEDGLLGIYSVKKENYDFRAVILFEYKDFVYADLIQTYNDPTVEEIKNITLKSIKDNKRNLKEIKKCIENQSAGDIRTKIKLSEFIQGQIKIFHWLSNKQYIEKNFHDKYGTIKILEMVHNKKSIKEILAFFFEEYEIGYDVEIFE